ncbi:Serine/threonine-protein phosphatase 7 long form [Glycine soja]
MIQVMPSTDPKIEPLLVQVEFLDVTKLGQVKIDDTLVTALRPESHMFHLPIGECTITLEDVALLLGLHVDGTPITGPIYFDWEKICTKYISVVPPRECTSGINT